MMTARIPGRARAAERRSARSSWARPLRAVGLLGCRALSGAAFGAAPAAEAASAIRGVAPEGQATYAGESFRCLSGREGGPLPLSAVNDDFCDCEDGSDEPGTSACAGQQRTLFYCPNEGSLPAYVYASRVGDGVCDCCDGSDEWQAASPCKNSCTEEGRGLASDRAKKEADLRSGVEQRRALVESARKGREDAGKELQRLEDQLPQLKEAERVANEAWLAAKDKLLEDQRRHDEFVNRQVRAVPAHVEEQPAHVEEQPAHVEEQAKTGKDTPDAATSTASASEDTPDAATSTATASEDTPDAAASTATASGQGEQKPVSEYAKWMEGAEQATAGAAHGDGAESTTDTTSKVVSEYTKWMDGAEEMLEDGTTTTTEEVILDDEGWDDDLLRDDTPLEYNPPPLIEEEEDEDSTSEGWLGRMWSQIRAPFQGARSASVDSRRRGKSPSDSRSEGWFGRTWSQIRAKCKGAWSATIGSWNKSPAERAVDRALAALEGATKAVKDGKKRVGELKRKRNEEAEIGDATFAFADLTDRCIEKKIEQYKYKVCFYNDAKQDHTSIGQWQRWESESVAVFQRGSSCSGGPDRSLRVRFQCGPKLEILDISEPSRCAYEAAATHPGACTEALLEALQRQGPRRPTDEL